jgi:UDP-N-acetylmuramyl tripeptide synthase
MDMQNNVSRTPVILVGKAVRLLSRLRGGGSALPGLVVERLDPSFLQFALGNLPHGVVLVSGTNGKTTTTRIVVELLKSQGLKVFTNPSGSNFTRGVVASVVSSISLTGTLDADIAVLELDEAHAVQFVKLVRPRYCLLLNVMRDQLDRFGEIDATATMLKTIAQATTDGVVLNREDGRVRRIADALDGPTISYYGLSDAVRQSFPSDDDLYGGQTAATPDVTPEATVVLEKARDTQATYRINGQTHDVSLALKGSYNLFNAAGAIALTQAVMGDNLRLDPLLVNLAAVTPAFGRGETVMVNGQPCELVLIKNPGGFRLALSSFVPGTYATMIAINDAYADGRDVSGLWDVDFASLRAGGVAMVSGIRAFDMALRLHYDDVKVTTVELELDRALSAFIKQDAPKRIYCTYTAMLKLRRALGTYTNVEKAL